MPRSRSSGRPAARPAPRAPPPAPVHHAPPPAPMQQGGGGSMLGGLAGTIAQGMAFGSGSAVAHRAVDSVMGPRTVQHEHVEVTQSSSQVPTASPSTTSSGSVDACINQAKAFQDCVMANGNDIGKCQFYIDMLNECRRGSSQGSFL